MEASTNTLQRYDWVRFQRHDDRRVLEGFIQERSNDGRRIRIGKEPDGTENEWYEISEITVLQQQTIGDSV